MCSIKEPKVRLRHLLLSFILLINVLAADIALGGIHLSDVLDKHQGEQLVLRGFLLQSSDGSWVLSTTANLAHCCHGTPQTGHQLLILEGEFPKGKVGKVVKVSGKLVSDSESLFYLKEAKLLEKAASPNLSWLAEIFGVLAVIILIIWKRLR